jgi:hypothetical protein
LDVCFARADEVLTRMCEQDSINYFPLGASGTQPRR